jgi:molecular chaperone GrpE
VQKLRSEEIKEEIAAEEAIVAKADEAANVEAEREEGAEEPLSAEEKLAEAESRAAEYLDGWQRARAEFANARKRLERQRSEAYLNAAIAHAQKMLPILDDFERATENVPDSVAEGGWFEGIVLVQRKLQAILDDLNVERITAVGEPFDPNLHEALALQDADGVESGTIIEELQTGYKLGDRVLRPSLVNVAA